MKDNVNPQKKPKPPRATLVNKLEALVANARAETHRLPGRDATIPLDAPDAILIEAIDLVAIANRIRHSPSADLAEGRAAEILLAGVRELGLKYRSGPPTLVDLAAKVAGTPCEKPLGDFVRAVCLDPNSRLEEIFTPEERFHALRDAYFGATPTTSRYKGLQRPKHFKEIAAAARLLLDDRRLPAAFSDCLRALVEQSGLALDVIAEKVGANRPSLQQWLSGSQPRYHQLPVLERLEKLFGVEATVLSQRITTSRVRVWSDEVITQRVRDDFEDANIPVPFLLGGDLAAWPMQKRVAWSYDNMVYASPFARYIKAGNEYPIRYISLSEPMAQEWKNLKTFKTDENPDPEFPRELKIPIGNGFTKTLGGRWRPVSAQLALSYVERTLSAIAEHVRAGGNDDSWVDSSGLGFLALAACHKAAADVIAARRFKLLKAANFFKQMNIPEPESGKVFAYPDINRLFILIGLFNPLTGFLYHNPPKLAPIPGLVDGDGIAKAESDWHDAITKLNAAFANMIVNLTKAAKTVRDPWLPINKLLDLDEPITPLYDALEIMAENRPDIRGDMLSMAQHDRDLLLNALIVHTKLRRKHFALLTWRADNTGKLQYIAGRWHIVIPRCELKNEETSAIEGNKPLDIELDHLDPLLYPAVERWLGKLLPDGSVDETGSSRLLKHGDSRGDWLFPGDKPGKPIVDNTTDDVFRTFIALYVAECPWRPGGIPGVLPFGLHAVRHLAATQVLKAGGSYEDAARVIWDTPKMVKDTYGWLKEVDKSRMNNEFFRQRTKRKAHDSDENSS